MFLCGDRSASFLMVQEARFTKSQTSNLKLPTANSKHEITGIVVVSLGRFVVEVFLLLVYGSQFMFCTECLTFKQSLCLAFEGLVHIGCYG